MPSLKSLFILVLFAPSLAFAGEATSVDLRTLVAIISALGAFWSLIGGALFWMVKHMIQRLEKNEDERYRNIEKSFNDEKARINHVREQQLALEASLNRDFVRREDYIRNQTVIESKLDRLTTAVATLAERLKEKF